MKKVRKGKQLLAMALSVALTISGLPAVVLAEGEMPKIPRGEYECTHEQVADAGYPCEICKISDDIQIQESDGEVVYLSEDKGVKTITRWTFPDDGNLSGGELALPGVNTENQADFDTMVSMLPTAISAEIEGEAGTTQVDIIDWSCPEYMQDENGNWPVTGEYVFTAELPEGYACDLLPTVKTMIGGVELYEGPITGVGHSFNPGNGELTVDSNEGTTAWRDNDQISQDPTARYAAIKAVKLENGVTAIGENAFFECTNLTGVTIPDKVITIGDGAFLNCTGLGDTLVIPKNVTSIGTNAFFMTAITSLDLSNANNLKIIDNGAFSVINTLSTVKIPGSVTSIGRGVFQNTALISVDLSEAVKLEIIGNSAFSGTKISSITIPENVTKVDNFAFLGCANLTSVTFISQNAPTLGMDVFNKTNTNLVIYVPEKATSYVGENWPKDKIVEGSALPLTALSISSGTLTPAFRMGQQTYRVTVPAAVDSVTVTPSASDTITVNGKNVVSGIASEKIALEAGKDHEIRIVVRTNDTLNRTYTITVTRPSVINVKAISGVTAPVRGGVPVTSITETQQYTGTVSWLPAVPSGGKFAANTEYTATITLTPKYGYTLQGVVENFFTVAGAAATNDANSGVITAVFPKTAPTPHSHSYGDWRSDGTDHWRQCSCGSISDKASHDFSKWTVDQKPDEDGKVSSSRECTVCGYKQTEKHVPQTLTDPEAGVTVKGDFTSGAAISVKEAVLHEEGTCKVCDEIRARQADGELIVLYDISLTSGINSGEMEISIPVDEKYNGQTVILLHCMDKEEERLEVKVEKGLVTFTTKSLSPFAILDTKKAESIKLASSSLILEIGKSRQLTYTVTPENIHSDKVTWTTSDKKVATVSPSGKVQAVKAGTAAITCTAADGGGAKATCKVTVKNTATPLLNLRGTAGKNSIRLNWNQVSNADGYEIYGSRCGSRYSYGKVKTITKGSMKTWTQKGIRSGTAYKYYIKAYKLVNGKKLYLKTSLTSHVATTGSRYTNTKTVTTTFTDITLAKGKTRQISARITPVKKGGKLANHVPEFRYKTTNSKVATVNASGKITAAGKGKCSVYVYANNGVTRRIMITVK